MTETFFIADTHFGHKNIIKFDGIKEYRNFDTIEEHDAELVRRWNSVVGKKDIVWVLGDFCFGKRNLSIAGELNGIKKLVLGNHDTYQSADYLKYFHKLYGAVEYRGAILTHVPVHHEQFERFRYNIHGHLHNNIINDERYLCVSAEQINLTPVNDDELRFFRS
jgi:calcineurin-like phosphoesterase family protein